VDDKARASSHPITEPQASSGRSGGAIPDAASALRNARLPSRSLRSYASRTPAVVGDREIAAYRGSPSRSSAWASEATTRRW